MHLAIDEVEAPVGELPHERREGDLRGVGPQREHRLAEEGAAERDAVDAADELAALPGLGAVREAQREERFVGRQHRRRDPGARRAVARAPTRSRGSRDRRRCRASPRSCRCAQRAREPARDVELGRQQQPARIGREPQDRLRVLVPGEDARGVGGEQARAREIAADGEQTARLGLARAAGTRARGRGGRPSLDQVTPAPDGATARSATARRSTCHTRPPVSPRNGRWKRASASAESEAAKSSAPAAASSGSGAGHDGAARERLPRHHDDHADVDDHGMRSAPSPGASLR